MSDYDPFAALRPKPATEEDTQEPDPGPEDPSQEPGAKEAAQTGPTPKSKEMESPPGLAERPTSAVSYGPVKHAAALLQGLGGFLLVGMVLMLIGTQVAIEAELVERRHGGGHDATTDIEQARAIASPLLALAGTAFVSAGTGIYLQQTWARGLGIALLILAGIASIMTILGPILCFGAAAALSRRRYGGWFR